MGVQLYGANGVAINADAGSNSERVALYDINGNPLSVSSGANLPSSPQFLPIGGRNDGAWRGARLDRYGNLRMGFDQCLFNDSCEGTVLNYSLWAPSLTTWTVPTQVNPQGINIGAGSTTASGCTAMLVSARQFAKQQQQPLRLRMRKRVVPQTNMVADFGFGAPSGVTAIVATGASWRYNSNGSVLPVLSFNGSESTGTDISSSLISSNYYSWEIIVDDDQIMFVCQDVSTGRSISEQILNIPLTQTRAWSTTHLPIFDRLYTTGLAGVAPTAHDYLADTMVVAYDTFRNQPFPHSQAAIGLSNLVSPNAYTPASTWANGAAPATSTLTANTGPAVATLGGLYQYTLVAGAESDYPIFAFQVPSPYTFYCTGIRISAQVVLSLTTGFTAPLISMWGAGFNASAASLATTTTVGTSYAANRVAIGTQSVAGTAVATVGTIIGNDLVWTPATPQMTMPGRWLAIILRNPIVGNLGSANINRGCVAIDGYFE